MILRQVTWQRLEIMQTFRDGSTFRANFMFRINVDHPVLGYKLHIGIWNVYMVIPG